MTINAGAWSAKGVRPLNEDSFFAGELRGGGGTEDSHAAWTGKLGGPGRFFFVADGMGGHAAGDEASAFVAEHIPAAPPSPIDEAALDKHVRGVHARLLTWAAERGTPKMGSTLTGVLLQEGECAYYNLGDSRVYRLRRGYIQRLSTDDSLAALVPGSPTNIITNAIGSGMANIYVQNRFSESIAVAGDTFLMCSDGVHGAVDDEALEALLLADGTPEEIAHRIVEQAIANNSDDNCTALVVRLIED